MSSLPISVRHLRVGGSAKTDLWENGELTSLLYLRPSILQPNESHFVIVTSSFLGGFSHSHQCWPEGAAVKLVTHFGYYGNGTGLLALYGGVEEGLMLVGVKLLVVWVELDQAVLGEHLLDLDFGHHQAVVQVLQVGVLARHLLLGHALCCLLQDVSHLQQVLTEVLDPW